MLFSVAQSLAGRLSRDLLGAPCPRRKLTDGADLELIALAANLACHRACCIDHPPAAGDQHELDLDMFAQRRDYRQSRRDTVCETAREVMPEPARWQAGRDRRCGPGVALSVGSSWRVTHEAWPPMACARPRQETPAGVRLGALCRSSGDPHLSEGGAPVPRLRAAPRWHQQPGETCLLKWIRVQ